MATKQDLEILRKDLTNVVETKANNLENKIEQVEYRMTIKLGTLLVLGFTSMATFWFL